MQTIGKVADQVGLTTHTLRYYEKEGLIPEIDKNDQGVRLYSEDDIMWIEIVKCLKETGMPISDIKRMIELSREGNSTIAARKKILSQHRTIIETQIRKLEESRARIDWKLDYYTKVEQESIKNIE